MPAMNAPTARTLEQILEAAQAWGKYSTAGENQALTQFVSQEFNSVNETINNLDSIYSTDAERVTAINGLMSTLNTTIESGDTTVVGLVNAAQTALQANIDVVASDLAAEVNRSTGVDNIVRDILDEIVPIVKQQPATVYPV